MTKGKNGGYLPRKLLAAFNGAVSTATYSIGLASSLDFGRSWNTEGIARLAPGSGWESNGVKDASIFWDPVHQQFVMLYAGYDASTHFQIGRATAPIFNGTWTKDAAHNPVLGFGSAGQPDLGGCAFPAVYLDGTLLRVWYVGFPAADGAQTGVGVICYAESTDYGQTFTKYGKVVDKGVAGSFTDVGVYPGGVYKSGSTFYIYLLGFHDPGGGLVARSGWVTCTTPTSAASYSAPTQMANYTGNITFGGLTWQDNLPRGIIPAGPSASSGYICFMDLWNPTVATGIVETCVVVKSPDLTSWAAPVGALMLPFDSWSPVSAENPSVIVAP